MEFHVLIPDPKAPAELIGPFPTRAEAEAESSRYAGSRVVESRPPTKAVERDGRPRMPFGKHKGEPIEDVPTGYIEWALESMERLDKRVREEMEAQLVMRRSEGVVRERGRA